MVPVSAACVYRNLAQAYAAAFRAADPVAVMSCFAPVYCRFDSNGFRQYTLSEKHKQGLKVYMSNAAQRIDLSTFQVAGFEILEESSTGAVAKVSYSARSSSGEENLQWTSFFVFQVHQGGSAASEIIMIITLNRYGG